MFTLYRFPGATCAAKVLLALAEKQAVFEDAVLSREALAEPWYRALNPAGVVPTLVAGDAVIVESSVILNYIEDAIATPPRLRPVDPLGRARMNHWLKRADDALPSVGVMTYALFARLSFLSKTSDALASYYASIPDDAKRARTRASIELGLDAAHVPAALSAIDDLQRHLDVDLSKSAFLAGGSYSLADAAITPLVMRIADLSLLAPPSALPSLHRWWDEVRRRPSFVAAIVAPEPVAMMAALRSAAADQAGRVAELRPSLAKAA